MSATPPARSNNTKEKEPPGPGAVYREVVWLLRGVAPARVAILFSDDAPSWPRDRNDGAVRRGVGVHLRQPLPRESNKVDGTAAENPIPKDCSALRTLYGSRATKKLARSADK